MNSLFKIMLANVSIILGIVFITYIILDWFNAYMNFVGNPLSTKLLFLLCISSIINGIFLQTKRKKAVCKISHE